MVKLIIVICMLSAAPVFGQVLDNRNGTAFTDVPFFNEDFIRENKVKQLKGTFVYKKQGELMKTTKFNYVYNFDRAGHLISTFETRTDDGTVDTTWNIYEYDVLDHLIVHRKTDQQGFTSVYYTYDSLDRVVTEEYKREIDTSNNEIVQSLTFNKETIQHFDYGNQKKQTRYNNYGLPYLDDVYFYNEDGYLIKREERIKMTSQVYVYEYEYNREGKLAAIRKKERGKDVYMEELRFRYDELGNLIEKHLYKDGVFTTDYQIIYNSKSKLLATVITRQVSTNFMMILRFQDYAFYD